MTNDRYFIFYIILKAVYNDQGSSNIIRNVFTYTCIYRLLCTRIATIITNLKILK